MKITIYSKPMCQACNTAKATILGWDNPDITLEYKVLGKDYALTDYTAIAQNGFRSFPLITVDDTFVGSLSDLTAKLEATKV